MWFYQQGHRISDIGEQAGGRRPDATETRFMSYQVLVHGGSGLFAFTGARLGDTIPYDDPTWDQHIRATFGEIHGLTAVPASSEAAPTVSAAPDTVRVMTRHHDGKTYVFAVREGDGEPLSVSLTLPGCTTAEVLGEDRSVPCEDGRLVDTFDRYAVHLSVIGG